MDSAKLILASGSSMALPSANELSRYCIFTFVSHVWQCLCPSAWPLEFALRRIRHCPNEYELLLWRPVNDSRQGY